MGSYTYSVGRYRGRVYQIAVRPAPSEVERDPEEVEDFSIVLYYRDKGTEENRQVVRFDTAHGEPHIDKIYGEKFRKEFDQSLSMMEAWEKVQE
ncbi:MAG: hypothetical protein SVS85_03190, partial [Candidatus Nanohaloarchaea archaeon]|nr:hypothetical protein [Candidatus Nanohaloarchaea archaeon]